MGIREELILGFLVKILEGFSNYGNFEGVGKGLHGCKIGHGKGKHAVAGYLLNEACILSVANEGSQAPVG